jgi:cephalosporin hydroxylase
MNTRFGATFFNRDQAALSPREMRIVRRFHELYYRHWTRGANTITVSWFGHLLLKCPLDLWIYQELLVRTQPDFVIETGTLAGGSALYLAMLLDQIGRGKVITIDTEPWADRPDHPRIDYLHGSSIDKAVTNQVREKIGDGRAMVILDSDHHAAHVYEELVLYSPLVKTDDYLIVEDTNVNGHPIARDFGAGPMEAVDKFLAENGDFVIDSQCERFLMTSNPRGYLVRK